MDKLIYMDNAATTAVREEVFEAMKPYFMELYGNPSSIYKIAQKSKEALNKAREQVASTFNASPSEIYFTASGTEADNWAIKFTADNYKTKGNHIITSKIEHHAILHTCEYLETKGFEVTYLNVDEYGLIDVEDLKKAIRPTTILISIMFANNEIGTIQPIAEIGEIAHEKGILFHTDAVQAVGHVPIDVEKLPIDMLSLSAHKLHGTKGVGALYVSKRVKIKPFIHGGGQENQKRAGTENVPGIVGLGEAITLAANEMDKENKRLTALRDKLITGLLNNIDHARLNGHAINRLPNNVNISFEFIEGEGMLLLLDRKGICASSGSACTSGSLDPSHVLLAIGLSHEKAHGSLRLSLGRDTTDEDIDYVIEELVPIVKRLREMSPLYEDFLKTAN